MPVTLRDVAYGDSPAFDRCKFGKMLDSMPERDRKVVETMLAKPVHEVGNNWLKRLLRSENYPVADRTFRRHRQRLCCCYGIKQKDYTK